VIKKIIGILRLFSKSRKEPYFTFFNILGFYPDKIDYYQLAMRHKSVSISTDTGHLLSNERLEFLGDAVLNSVVTDILYRRYHNRREGFLTDTRSKIVKRDSLNQLAIEIGLDKLIQVSKHVNSNTNKNIYGNALEALMGAIYLDFGYKKCKKFVEERLLKAFVNLDELAKQDMNFKSILIEWCQKHRLQIEFVLINESVERHNKHIFDMQLIIDGQDICRGKGLSKKESQQNASFHALQIINSSPRFIEELHSIHSVSTD
jgi:ribonuclease-3